MVGDGVCAESDHEFFRSMILSDVSNEEDLDIKVAPQSDKFVLMPRPQTFRPVRHDAKIPTKGTAGCQREAPREKLLELFYIHGY